MLACQGTAQLVGMSPAQVAALGSYGESLGLAFQVVDDILDFTSTEQELGKPVGSDLRQGTVTLPVILMRDHRLVDGRFPRRVRSRRRGLAGSPGPGKWCDSGRLAEAEVLVERARTALDALPAGTERDALDALATYVTRRAR